MDLKIIDYKDYFINGRAKEVFIDLYIRNRKDLQENIEKHFDKKILED
jgi:hypothetical protein